MFLCYLHELRHIKCRSMGRADRDRATPHILELNQRHGNHANMHVYYETP